MAFAWFRQAHSSVYARIRSGRSKRGDAGGAGALVQLAASRGGAALSASRGSHGIVVRLLAGGDCFACGGGGAKLVYRAAAGTGAGGQSSEFNYAGGVCDRGSNREPAFRRALPNTRARWSRAAGRWRVSTSSRGVHCR